MLRALLIVLLFAALPARAVPGPWSVAASTQMLAAIDSAATHGLAPERYGRDALARALASGDAESAAALAEIGFRRLAGDFLAGALPVSARRAWHIGGQAADDTEIAAALERAHASGDVMGTLAALAPSHPGYAALRRALAATPPAEAGTRNAILASLERWRWMPRDLGGRHLWVNVPAFEVRLLQAGAVVATHRVIVGKRSTPTPQFNTMVNGIVINPEWIVPASIQREGIGKLLASNPKAAAAKGYRKTPNGITQAPGPQNQLGQLKLRMPNPYAIYLHDTPAKTLFDRKVRAMSHGCIRTQDPFGLAERLLAGTPGWDRKAIDAALATRKTVDVPLASPMPVYIVYFTAEPDGAGGIRVHTDLYGRDASILAGLRPGG